MAANDVRVLKHGFTVQRFRTDDRNTSGNSDIIPAGDVVKRDNANFANIVLTGDPEISTDIVLGVTKTGSDETASAEGVVDVELIGVGTVLESTANNTSNVDTDAKLKGVTLDYVTFDRSSADVGGTLTIDEDDTDDPNVHGLCILDGDITDGTLWVTPHINATIFGSLVGQTMD